MKISIVGGAGRVGASLAYALILRSIPFDKLVLNDVVDTVFGEAMDLSQAAAAMGAKLKVTATKTIKDCASSDIIIITAGISLAGAKTLDRYELLAKNKQILASILEGIGETKAIFLITTNPVDVMTYFLAESIHHRYRAIGISTLTDTARMNTITPGYLIGEHSGIMIPIGGTVDTDKVKDLGTQVVASKGGTWYTTPVGISSVVQAIVKDEQKLFPLSVQLEGEYDLSGVCLSVPCVVGRGGIQSIKQIPLNPRQKEALAKAAASVKDAIAKAQN